MSCPFYILPVQGFALRCSSGEQLCYSPVVAPCQPGASPLFGARGALSTDCQGGAAPGYWLFPGVRAGQPQSNTATCSTWNAIDDARPVPQQSVEKIPSGYVLAVRESLSVRVGTMRRTDARLFHVEQPPSRSLLGGCLHLPYFHDQILEVGGDTPGTLPACARLPGRIRASFWRASEERVVNSW